MRKLRKMNDRFARYKLLHKVRPMFDLLLENFPENLPAEKKQQFTDVLTQALVEFRRGNSGKLRSLLNAINEAVEQFRQSNTAVQNNVL